ncbi:MAG: MFS transporter [Legionellaceae bacterium]|nr:MFS transporter [Legionellaceae bacterium]
MLKSKKSALIAWLICGVGALFYSYEYFLRITPSVMEPALREHFSLSAMGFGVFSSFYYYSYVPMQLPVGVLMDRWGPRRLLTLACAVSVLGMWFFAATDWVSLAAAGRFLTGFGSAFAFVGVLKLATIWLPEDRLALVAGLATALGTIGAMMGDNLLGAMVAHVGWKDAVNLTAVFGLALLVVLWFGIHDKKQSLEEDGGTVSSFNHIWVDLKCIVSNKQIWVNGAYGCLVYLPTTVFAELWGIPYLSYAHGLNLSTAEFANSILFMGCMVGAPFWGYVSDRIKQRKLPMRMGAFGAGILMTCILYFPGVHGYTLYVLMFVLGFFYSAQAIVFAVGRELSPKEAGGTAIAMTNMCVMLGAIFLQPLVGRILDWCVLARYQGEIAINLLSSDEIKHLYTAADYQLAMAVIPIGIFIAAALTFFLKETHAHAKYK